MKNFKRALTLILAISLTLNCITMTAFAEEEPSSEEPSVEAQNEEQEEPTSEPAEEQQKQQEPTAPSEEKLLTQKLTETKDQNIQQNSAPITGTTGDCTWTLDGTVLTISGTGAMEDYTTTSAAPWGTSITKVIINDGVTKIGNNAFRVYASGFYSEYSGLTSITIPASVTEIGDFAFYNCYNLKNITIPEGVTTIGKSAFFDCDSLTSITIPEGVTSIGNSAFCGCSSLTNTTIPSSITSIGDYTFEICHNLAYITIPDSVTYISDNAFESAGSNVGGVIFIVTEGSYAYDYAVQHGITVQKNLNTSGTIGECTWTRTGTKVVISGNGYMADCYDGAPWGRDITEAVIEDGVTCIGEDAFLNSVFLTTVTIGKDVETIYGGAFDGCNNLTNIAIPASVTFIIYSAFRNCSNIESINVESGNSRYVSKGNCLIEKDTKTLILGCKNSVIPTDGSVTSIGQEAFYKCSNLTSITIPASVMNIGNHAFFYCSSLTSITLSEDVTSIGDSAFDGCSSLTSITIPESVTHIGRWAFGNCRNLESVTFKSSFTYIGDYAFYDCSSNLRFYCPISISAAYQYAINNGIDVETTEEEKTTGNLLWYLEDGRLSIYGGTTTDDYETVGPWGTEITSLHISDEVQYIGDNAFNGCDKLLVAIIPESVTGIGDAIFSGCTNLEAAVIPNSVTSIGTDAFKNCNSVVIDTSSDSYASLYADTNEISKNIGTYSTGAVGDCTYYRFGNDVIITGTGSIGITFYQDNSIEAVIIDNSVTNIGEHAFNGCSSLTNITIPEGITSIGSSAFYYCDSLTSIIIPEGVTSIGNSAFSRCSSLTSITIPEGVTSIGNNAFYNCDSLTDITIPTSVTSIGDYAFYNCNRLKSITIPNSLTNFGYYAFRYCNLLKEVHIKDIAAWCNINMDDSYSNPLCCGGDLYINDILVKNIVIPDGVTSIGDYTFYGCYLYSVTIPNTVLSIGNWGISTNKIIFCNSNSYAYSFAVSNGYTAVTLDIPITGLTGGLSWELDGTSLTISGNAVIEEDLLNESFLNKCKNIITDIIICDGITGLGDYAFYNCSSLTSITIPEGITSIENWAFSQCNSLTTITIPDSVTRIGEGAFKSCSCLANITIPEGVTSIGDEAFNRCKGLTSINIPYGVTSIGYEAFYGCSNLSNITIPNSVLSIGNGAFEDCNNLTSITIPESVTSIEDYAFWGCSSLTSITIGKSVRNIGDTAFASCISLEKITVESGNSKYICIENCLIDKNTKTLILGCKNCVIPDDGSILSIGSSAFFNRKNLISITIPDSVTRIGDDAFGGCSSLTSITIPEGVKSIGEYAFANCSNLTHITILGRITEIKDFVFDGCNNLTSITIPDSVTSIGDSAFEDCSSLTSISIPDSVTSIGEYAFYKCSSLTNIEIPEGVKNLGFYVFCHCSKLESIIIPDSVTSISQYAFEDCYNLTIYCSMNSAAHTYAIENGITYKLISGTSGDCTWTLDGTVLTISGNGLMEDNVVPWGTSITEVVINNGVTSIGDRAFYDCSSLTSITIPDSVTNIGAQAFDGCSSDLIIYTSNSYVIDYAKNNNIRTSADIEDSKTGECTWKLEGTKLTISGDGAMADYRGNNAPWGTGITELIIEEGVTHIGAYAFYGCISLTRATIPDGVTSIGDAAFSECSGLKIITISASVTDIGTSAFENCNSLESINVESGNSKYMSKGNCLIEIDTRTLILGCMKSVIPTDGSVTSIGDCAFDNCISLTSITIPSSITKICNAAFHGCSSLANITIPNSVISIGKYAFSYCVSLESITVESGNQKYYSSGNCLIEKDTNKLILGCKNSIIPDSVTSIGEGAFDNCDGLISITIPESVTRIDSYAFLECKGLTSLTVKGYISNIGENLFSYCSNLTEINILGGFEYLGFDIFSDCDSLTNITIPGSVKTIGSLAFPDCDNLTHVTILEGVTTIEYKAFIDCGNLESIIIPNSVTEISEAAFKNCYNLTIYCSMNSAAHTYAIENGITYKLISGTSGDCTWTLDGTVLTISGNGSMEDNVVPWGTSITEVVINNGVTSIGDRAFYDCSSLTSITIPDSVTNIGDYAFSNCSSLTSITFPISVTSIGDFAFSLCSSLTSIAIPEGVTSIGNGAFIGCSSLTSIAIPEGVTSIGNGAFFECSSLESINVESGNTKYTSKGNCLIEINSNTLILGCMNSVIPTDGSVKNIGNKAFYKCNGLININIPEEVTSIGNSAFSGCSGLSSITIPNSVTSIGNNAFQNCNNLTIYCHSGSYAHTYAINKGIKYALIGTSGDCTWTLDGTVLTISGDGAMEDYAAPVANGLVRNAVLNAAPTEPAPWGTDVTEVIVEDGVTYVGKNAFAGCSDLGAIELPLTVIEIGDGAFDGCDDFTIACPKTSYAYTYAEQHSITTEFIPGCKYVSLTLDSDININFYMDLPEDAEAEMVFTIRDREVKGAKKTNANGTYFSCPVNALEMNETVKASYTYDGKTYIYEHSVTQYLQSILAGDYDAPLKTLAKKIANYGYYTQLYLQNLHPSSVTIGEGGYAAISKYTDADINVAAADLTDTFETPAANDNFSVNGRSLQFDSATALNYYVTVKSGNEPTATAVNTATGKEKAVDIKQYSGRVYIITVQDIYATELADDIIVTVNDGENNLSLTGSVLDCCGAIIAAHSADAKTEADNLAINSIVSFYEYYEAAMAYKEK